MFESINTAIFRRRLFSIILRKKMAQENEEYLAAEYLAIDPLISKRFLYLNSTVCPQSNYTFNKGILKYAQIFGFAPDVRQNDKG